MDALPANATTSLRSYEMARPPLAPDDGISVWHCATPESSAPTSLQRTGDLPLKNIGVALAEWLYGYFFSHNVMVLLSLTSFCLLALPVTGLFPLAGPVCDLEQSYQYPSLCDRINRNVVFTPPGVFMSTTLAVPAGNGTELKGPHPCLLFSGPVSNYRNHLANVTLMYAPQVCRRYSLLSKRSDNRFLVLLPRPHVILTIVLQCYDAFFLLLCCGDIESNPGPKTLRSGADTESEQLNAMFMMIKGINDRTAELVQTQADMSSDIRSIKSSQVAMESKVSDIINRLQSLENMTKNLSTIEQDVAALHKTTVGLLAQKVSFQARLDDLEDRSRRNNLILRGVPDARESWEETEAKVASALTASLGGDFPRNSIERAHRLGAFSSSRCRPVIVKFLSYKTKNMILASRSKLKPSNIMVNEDFSPATRHARSKLLEFGKSLPNTPSFKLRYNKLFVNNTCYTYDPVTDVVKALSDPPHERPPERPPVESYVRDDGSAGSTQASPDVPL